MSTRDREMVLDYFDQLAPGSECQEAVNNGVFVRLPSAVLGMNRLNSGSLS